MIPASKPFSLDRFQGVLDALLMRPLKRGDSGIYLQDDGVTLIRDGNRITIPWTTYSGEEYGIPIMVFPALEILATNGLVPMSWVERTSGLTFAGRCPHCGPYHDPGRCRRCRPPPDYLDTPLECYVEQAFPLSVRDVAAMAILGHALLHAASAECRLQYEEKFGTPLIVSTLSNPVRSPFKGSRDWRANAITIHHGFVAVSVNLFYVA